MDVAEDRGFCGKIANVCQFHVLLAFGPVSSASAALPVPERVRFASLDAAGGNGVEVEAMYYRPAGALPDGGRPAVIALHGVDANPRVDAFLRDELGR